MTTLEIYKAQYEEECTRRIGGYTKYEWAAMNIFDLCTYDGSLDEKFVKAIIEVCNVILEDRNFEYIKDEKNYIKYILVCQIFEQFRWIDWGTSIRGAWFQRENFKRFGGVESIVSKDILEECKWWTVENGEWTEHKIDAVPFTVENLKTLVEFMSDGDNRKSCSESSGEREE